MQIYNVLAKVVEDFQSIEMDLELTMLMDPLIPYDQSSVDKIYKIVEASMIHFETIEIQSYDYQCIIDKMNMVDIYNDFRNIILSKKSLTVFDCLPMYILHSSLTACELLIMPRR
jgi:hypothetical protein